MTVAHTVRDRILDRLMHLLQQRVRPKVKIAFYPDFNILRETARLIGF